jgi:hypothetical protein
MKLELIKFHEDTNICELDVDEEGKQMLMELGFNALLRKALEAYENERETDDSF